MQLKQFRICVYFDLVPFLCKYFQKENAMEKWWMKKNYQILA